MMLKWERKLIQYIDRHLFMLVWILVTLIALFIRRSGLWHVSFDFGSQFYTDDPGYLHTPFYTMFIWLVSHIPVTPIRTVKMIISLFDFGVAAAAVVLIRDGVRCDGLRCEGVYRDGLRTESNSVRLLVCYALLLISPVVIENGLTWIHMDSICFFAVLCALIARNRNKNVMGWILLGAAAALQMQYGVVLIAAALYWLVRKLAGRAAGPVAGAGSVAGLAGGPAAGLAVFAGLNVIACIWSGTDLLTGLYQLVNWLIMNPGTGEVFSSLTAWLAVMAAQYAYLIAVSTLIAVFVPWGDHVYGDCNVESSMNESRNMESGQNKRGVYLVWTAAVCHLVLTIYLGWILQYGYFS